MLRDFHLDVYALLETGATLFVTSKKLDYIFFAANYLKQLATAGFMDIDKVHGPLLCLWL